MILLLIFAVIMALLIFGAVKAEKHWRTGLTALCISFALIIGITLAIFTAFTINAHVGVEPAFAAAQDERALYVYELENQTYLNDNNIGTTELINAIHSFNTKVYTGRYWANNFWLKDFEYHFWDDIEPININDYAAR